MLRIIKRLCRMKSVQIHLLNSVCRKKNYFFSLFNIQEKSAWGEKKTSRHLPPLHDQITMPTKEIPKKKAEIKKIQIKANTAIKIFLLICHEISWLYIFQSTIPASSPNPSKRFRQSFQCNNRCWIVVLSTFSFQKQNNPNHFNGHTFLSNKEKTFTNIRNPVLRHLH